MHRNRDFDLSLVTLFAEELKLARARAGLPQEQLADKIGYSASLVAKIETTRGAPTLDFATRCDDVLGMPGSLARMHKSSAVPRSPPGSGRSSTMSHRLPRCGSSSTSSFPGLPQTEVCPRRARYQA